MQSQHNPKAIRSSRGIWNEDSLPILDWEDPIQRIVLPADLQGVMGVPESVLRWAQAKRGDVLGTHSRDREIIAALDVLLPFWSYVGTERENHEAWRVLFEVNGRWYATTIGRDENGSLNVVTMFGSRRRGFLKNRLGSLVPVVERKK